VEEHDGTSCLEATMEQKDLFQLALGLTEPWFVTDVRLDLEDEERGRPGELHLYLNFRPGGRFACAQCGSAGLEVHDTMERTWQHLNFFQHLAWLHARTPRTRCGRCGVHLVSVPWARPNSGFTLLFEAFALMLVVQMPVLAASRLLQISDTRLWRILKAYVERARTVVDMSKVSVVAVDETSSRRGHTYVSLFADPKPSERKVLFVTEGKDQTTFDRFLEDFTAHGGKAEAVTDVVADMSAAFAAGAAKCFPGADLTHDKFHAMKLVSEAVDKTRRLEVASRPELKGTRYIFLKNPLNLTEAQQERWDQLKDGNLRTLKAYQLYLAFRDIWDYAPEKAPTALGRWISWAMRSRIEPMVKAARTIRLRVPSILRVLSNDLTTAVMEGINSLVQAAKARARGYRNPENFITIIYLIAGKLDLRFAHTK
jgi:transposase